MRRLLVAVAAAVSIAATTFLVAGRAEAMPLPGAAGLGAAAQNDLIQDVRMVCRSVWNGYGYVRQCYWVPGRPVPYPYYGYSYGPPPPYFYRPRPYRYY